MKNKYHILIILATIISTIITNKPEVLTINGLLFWMSLQAIILHQYYVHDPTPRKLDILRTFNMEIILGSIAGIIITHTINGITRIPVEMHIFLGINIACLITILILTFGRR